MVYVDGAFHFSILVYHLVFIWDAADVVRPFSLRRQLGRAFRRGGKSKNETANLVGLVVGGVGGVVICW